MGAFSKQKKLLVDHNFSDAWRTRLEGQGTQPQDGLFGRKIDIAAALTEFQVTTVGMKPAIITAKRQLSYIHQYVNNPEAYNVIGISSFPSDLRAKQVALWMFSMMMAHYLDQAKERRNTNTMPRWYRVYGGLGDALLNSNEKPGALFISNITVDSTNYKVEKVRDLLEKYNRIPRVVVIGGTDPLTFFRTRLHYPTDAALYIGGALKIESL